MKTHKISKLLTIAIFTVLAMIISSCSLEVRTNVYKDGSGEIIVIMSITEDDIAAVLEEEGIKFVPGELAMDLFLKELGYEDFSELCEDFEEEALFTADSIPFVVETVVHDDIYECQMVASFDSIEELQGLYSEMEFSSYLIEMEADGEFYYLVEFDELDLDETDVQEIESYGLEVELLWALSAPGEVTVHNATWKDGNTLYWDIMEIAGTQTTFEASSEPDSSIFGPLGSKPDSGDDGTGIFGDSDESPRSSSDRSIPNWALSLAALLICGGGFFVIAAAAVWYFFIREQKGEEEGEELEE